MPQHIRPEHVEHVPVPLGCAYVLLKGAADLRIKTQLRRDYTASTAPVLRSLALSCDQQLQRRDSRLANESMAASVYRRLTTTSTSAIVTGGSRHCLTCLQCQGAGSAVVVYCTFCLPACLLLADMTAWSRGSLFRAIRKTTFKILDDCVSWRQRTWRKTTWARWECRHARFANLAVWLFTTCFG